MMHGKRIDEFATSFYAMMLILRPEDNEPLPKDFYARILKGVSSHSFTEFLGRYIRLLKSSSAFELYGGVHMLELLCFRARGELTSDAEFLDALFHSHSLLSWLIAIIKSPDTATPPLDDQTGAVIQTSLHLIIYCLRHIIVEAVKDNGKDFLRFLCRADLFGAVENVLATKGETVRDVTGKSVLMRRSSKGNNLTITTLLSRRCCRSTIN